jgi:hypothetical protein
MIEKGEQALNIELDLKSDLVIKAGGSLNVAQLLCFYACQKANVLAIQEKLCTVHCDISAAIANVQTDLSRKFAEATRFFAALGGPRDNTCLRLLKELATHEDRLLSLTRLKESKDEFARGIQLFITQGWAERLYQKFPDSKNYIFFDQSACTLGSDDPQFTFYLTNLQFSELAEEVGKVIALERRKVFLCYCKQRQDSTWLRRLQVHLRPLERHGIIDLWDIAKVPPGSLLEEELQSAIEASKVAILLVSADFLASDYILDEELPRLLSQAESRGTIIIPLIITHCMFVGSLDIFQPANPPERPLELMSMAEVNQILAKLARTIQQKFA